MNMMMMMKGKTDDLISSMFPNSPHILCFTEHHLKKFEFDQINVDGYRLGAACCRQVVKRGVFVYLFKKTYVYKY
jgi:hypothetical protein